MYEENTIGISFIGTVIDRTTCARHKADVSEPCWVVVLAQESLSAAICNKRAKKAGFNARINSKSLRRQSA